MANLDSIIDGMPKVELHLHIEGTFEPEQMFVFAERNRMAPPYPTLEAARAAYRFSDLQSFLDLYYAATSVIRTERDFYELAMAYLVRVAAENVRHAEIFFDPRAHTGRGIPFAAVYRGLRSAMEEAEKRFGMSGGLIMCFLRHESAAVAMDTLLEALPFKDGLLGVGLDSGERGNPPEKFEAVFARARAEGLRGVAHAGEEGPPSYITGALDRLGVRRIDHGVRCDEDPALVDRLVRDRVPLTVCPLSNVKLRVVDRLAAHNLRRLLERGVLVTVNSDDPAYFGGYLAENFKATAAALGLDTGHLRRLGENAIEAAFVSDGRRAELRGELGRFFDSAP